MYKIKVEHTQELLQSNSKPSQVYPCNSQFYYIKMGFKGGKYLGKYGVKNYHI